jgi:Ulp1 family protease
MSRKVHYILGRNHSTQDSIILCGRFGKTVISAGAQTAISAKREVHKQENSAPLVHIELFPQPLQSSAAALKQVLPPKKLNISAKKATISTKLPAATLLFFAQEVKTAQPPLPPP